MLNIKILDVKSNDNINYYIIKNLSNDKIYTISNIGIVLNSENFYNYLKYCYDNYFNIVRGYKDFLDFEKEDCNVYSLYKYKIYNYTGLCASKLLN